MILVFWTRSIALGVASVCSFATTAVLVNHFGASSVGWMSLVVSVVGIMSFIDLGMNAVVTNAVAGRTNVPEVIAASSRALLGVSVLMLGVAAVGWPLGLWSHVVGGDAPEGVAAAAALSAAIYCVCLPLTQAQAALTGLGAVQVSVAAGAIRPMIVLLGCTLAATFGGSLALCLCSSAVGLLLSLLAQVAWLRSRYRITVPSPLRRARRAKPLGIIHRGTATSMLIVNLSIPVLLGTDQLILAQAAQATLPEYALVNQFFTPLLALVAALGSTLWARFGSARSERRDERAALTRLTLAFAIGASAVCVLMISAVLTIGMRISLNEINVGAATLGAFSALMFVQSLRMPLAMYLTGPSGLRSQARVMPLIAIANVPLSYLGAVHWGAAGPPAASASLLMILFLVNVRTTRTSPMLDWTEAYEEH